MKKAITLSTGFATALMLTAFVPMTGAATPTSSAPAAPKMILVAGTVMIGAPETVDPGEPVTVTVTGGGPGGRIELWGPVTQSAKGDQIESIAESGGSTVLTAPFAPGSYELRYVNAARKTLARISLDVAAPPIVLSVPRGLSAGIDSAVEWRGPASPGDMIQVFDPASGAVVVEVPAIGQPGAANIAVLRAPYDLGNYQIRYWSGARQTALRSLPVTVSGGHAWLRSPIEVFVGETFAVEWLGPTDADHLYQIVDPETGSVFASQTGSGLGSAKLTAPSKPGAYRLQFVTDVAAVVLADLPLDVDPK